MSVIKAIDVNKIYSINKKSNKLFGKKEKEEMHAVSNLNMEIEMGEMVGFIGPNGAGKSTTLKMLSGILNPTSGLIEVNGFYPYKREKKFLKDIAIIMGQKNQLEWDLTPYESYEINRIIYDISKDDFNKHLNEMVEMMEVERFLHVPVMTLSAGERMKMEIINSLIHNPKVIFLDEPTIGLDIVSQNKLYKFIKSYKKKNNVTMLLTSHYLGDIKSLCERLVIINKGKKIFDDDVSKLSKIYSDEKVITLNLSNPVDEKLMDGFGKYSKISDCSLEIREKESNVQQVIAKLREVFGNSLNNINISDEPIEEIVCKIFES